MYITLRDWLVLALSSRFHKVLPLMSLPPLNPPCPPTTPSRSLWSVTPLVWNISHARFDLAIIKIFTGAAITLLDSVYLPLWLPAGTTFTTIGYGLPRVRYAPDLVAARLIYFHIGWQSSIC